MRILFIIFIIFLSFASNLPAQGYLCIVGGGTENYNDWSDEPYQWMVTRAQNGPALVLHYDEGSTWLEKYFKSFGAVSAQSLVISSREAANNSANYQLIRKAKLIFLRGGDQYKYYQYWKGTLTEQAIREVFQSGGVIGGTSAGLAVLGGIDYIATNRSAISKDCIQNPFHRDITLADDFLPFLPGVLFDSHFTRRARIGRLLAFIANWNKTWQTDIPGVGIDERTAICIEQDGKGLVSGAGAVFIMHPNSNSFLKCESQVPLNFTNWTLHALTAGFKYDFVNRQLISSPEGAKSIQPENALIQTPAAKLIFQSLKTPVQGREQFYRFYEQAREKSIILITGPDDKEFLAYLTQSLQFSNINQIPLTAENFISNDLAKQIDETDFFILAGLTLPAAQNLWNNQNVLSEAMFSRLKTPEVHLLWVGTSLPVAGTSFITNIESNQYNLQDGKLLTKAGARLIHPINIMPAIFRDDDFSENRIGGIFWQLIKSPGAPCLLLDDESAVEIYQDELTIHSQTPVLLIDGQGISVIDSSDYKRRSYLSPQQTAAFYGAQLHCLSADTEFVYNLKTRTWQQKTSVQKNKNQHGFQIPSDFQIQPFPNPGTNFIHFKMKQKSPKIHNLEFVIYNILGQIVFEKNVHGNFFEQDLLWDGISRNGGLAPAGIYFASINFNQTFFQTKFTLLR